MKEKAASRRLLGLPFWLALAFGVLCVMSGVGIAVFGPSYLPEGRGSLTPSRSSWQSCGAPLNTAPRPSPGPP